MFEPLNALERLLIAAATDPGAQGAFVQAFLESEVYISPAGEPPTDGTVGDMVVSHQPDGTPAPAVFTAAQRVTEVVGPQARVWGWNGRAILEKSRGRTVHLNPNLVPQVIWTPSDINQILDGRPLVQIPAGTQVMLTHPLVTPDTLIAALKARLSPIKDVKGAWILQADQGAQRSWLLGVRHQGSWAVVDRAIAAAVQDAGPTEVPLQAMPITDNTLSRELVRGIPIVATKRLFGIF